MAGTQTLGACQFQLVKKLCCCWQSFWSLTSHISGSIVNDVPIPSMARSWRLVLLLLALEFPGYSWLWAGRKQRCGCKEQVFNPTVHIFWLETIQISYYWIDRQRSKHEMGESRGHRCWGRPFPVKKVAAETVPVAHAGSRLTSMQVTMDSWPSFSHRAVR